MIIKYKLIKKEDNYNPFLSISLQVEQWEIDLDIQGDNIVLPWYYKTLFFRYSKVRKAFRFKGYDSYSRENCLFHIPNSSYFTNGLYPYEYKIQLIKNGDYKFIKTIINLFKKQWEDKIIIALKTVVKISKNEFKGEVKSSENFKNKIAAQVAAFRMLPKT